MLQRCENDVLKLYAAHGAAIPDAVPVHRAWTVQCESHRFLWQTSNYRAHVASFSHRYFRESTRSWALVKREIKSVLLDDLETGSVHHRSVGRSLFPEVTWFIKVNRWGRESPQSPSSNLESLQSWTAKNHELQDALKSPGKILMSAADVFLLLPFFVTHCYDVYRWESRLPGGSSTTGNLSER